MRFQICHSEPSEESPAWMRLATMRFFGVCSALGRSKNTSTCPALAVTTPSPSLPSSILYPREIFGVGPCHRELATQGLPCDRKIVGADGLSGNLQRGPNLLATWNLTIIESISSHFGNVPRGTSSARLPRSHATLAPAQLSSLTARSPGSSVCAVLVRTNPRKSNHLRRLL